MNYAKTRLLEVTEFRASGKGGKVKPLTLLAQTAMTGPHGASRSSSPSSEAISRRSSAYTAVHEAAVARKALLQAQLEAERTVARLSEDKAECNREHQAIVEEIEAVQNELRIFADRKAQGQDMQAAEIYATVHRIMEMKELPIQRELRMESQLQGMCSQTQAMGTVLKNIQPQTENTVPSGLTEDAEDSPPKLATKK